MPKKLFSLTSASEERVVKPIDTDKLLLPFVLGVGLAGLFALVFTFPMLSEDSLIYPYGGYYFVFLWCISFVPALAVVTYRKYGTMQLYYCGLILKLIEADRDFKLKSSLAKMLFGYLKWIYSFLGKHASAEEVQGFCYMMERYQDFSGQKKRGLIAQRVEAISNKHFYIIEDANRDTPSYDTMRRLFIEFAEKGSKLFRTKEHKYFERGE